MRGSPHLLGGEPPPVRFVYWLLIAIYTFAALAQGALTGDELVCAAAAVPALRLQPPPLWVLRRVRSTQYWEQKSL